MVIRVTGLQLHAARVLVGLSRESLAERAGFAATQSANGRLRATYPRGDVFAPAERLMCLRVKVRFSGDGVSALSGASPDYLMEAVPPPSTPNDSKGLHLGMDLAARVRHAGVFHARRGIPICEGLAMVRR